MPEFANIRNPDLLGPIIGSTVVDVTQEDQEQWEEEGLSFICLHFSNGYTVTFPISDEGFKILGD